MHPIKKRKADDGSHKDEETASKRVKHTTSTHTKPRTLETAKEPSPQPSSEPSPVAGSTSDVEDEADGYAPKSFQDLGIIQSLCDACTALGYKVHISSWSRFRLLLKLTGTDSNTNRSNTFGPERKRPHRACRDWQWENGCICTPNSTG